MIKYCHECKNWEQIGKTMFGECEKMEDFIQLYESGDSELGIRSDFGCIHIEDYD